VLHVRGVTYVVLCILARIVVGIDVHVRIHSTVSVGLGRAVGLFLFGKDNLCTYALTSSSSSSSQHAVGFHSHTTADR
jgi:hypothetical protein